MVYCPFGQHPVAVAATLGSLLFLSLKEESRVSTPRMQRMQHWIMKTKCF